MTLTAQTSVPLPSRFHRPVSRFAAAGFFSFLAGLLWTAERAEGAGLSFSTAQPVQGTLDIANFSGAGRERNNILGNGSTDGGGDDGGTYIAHDRPHQGQTFTTGSSAAGYHVKAVWLKHAGYAANNTVITWWRMANGGQFTVRITDPSAAASGAFALRAETAVLTGTEAGTPNDLAPRAASVNSLTGTGVWVKFAFDTPVNLQPNKQYGFDVSSNASQAFFETLGIRDAASGGNPYAAGSAYNGNTNGFSDSSLNPLAGDRVFMVELGEGTVTSVDTTPYATPLADADPFPLERVRLLDGRFKQNQELHRTGYLAWLPPDRLLYQFRQIAGLPQPEGVTHLGGWEGGSGFTAVRGHMLGHYLTAASKMYAATGDASYLTKINYLVAELKRCQDAIGAQEIAAGRVYGYLSGFPESYFTTLETNPGGAPVPFYTMHKIMAGLVDAYIHCGNQQALDIVIAMSDYHRWRIDRLNAAQIEAMFRTDYGNSEEWGGMNETLSEIYRLSLARGDANALRHLEFAKIFHRDWFITPLASNLDQLEGLHANTHIPQVVGHAHVASMLNTADTERARLYTAAGNFWQMVINNHSLVLGGNSYSEHFHNPGKETGPGGTQLTVGTAETCNTHNMLKLTKELFQHTPTAAYGDYYEHALHNHILASLAPDTGMPMYYVPTVSGHFKTYSQPEGSCWCCTGTGIENTARYNEAIYFHKGDALWINQFIPSTLDWSEQGMTVRMETEFPRAEQVTLTLTCAQPAAATLRIRMPSWLAAVPTVTINGVAQPETPVAGTWLELSRTWQNGDVIAFSLPMALRVDRSRDDPTQVSLFYGPILLAGDLGTAGMPASDQAADQWAYANLPRVPTPSLVTNDPDDPAAWVKPAGAPLTFTTDAAYAGTSGRTPIVLRPFYEIHHARYAMYWNQIAPSGVATWSGAGLQDTWTNASNWDAPPAAGWKLDFAAASGGTASNDLAPGTRIHGIDFSPAAGAHVLGGNSITLRGDVANTSSFVQRIDLPLILDDQLAWRFDTATADIVLGGPLTGTGSLEKTGPGTLVLTGDASFGGSANVAAGSLQIGNGGTSGSLGQTPVALAAGSKLIVDRADDITLASAVSGSGTLVKRGAGTLTLTAPSGITGDVRIESGKLRFGTRQVRPLLHRWSFNGNLADSAGGADATMVDVGPNNATLGPAGVTLAGGTKTTADYVSLGGGLLPKDGSPVTLEFWATPHSFQTWSRVFDVGASDPENLFMSWSQGSATTDRAEWRDGTTSRLDNTVAPYTDGTEYHIVLMIAPGAGANGTTRVTWHAAPATAGSLGAGKGSFDTTLALSDLNDADFWLGRSHYGDATANATYNEARVWKRVFNTTELEQLHDLGPDSVGTFEDMAIAGGLDGVPALVLGAAAELDLGGQSLEVSSLSGAPDSIVRLSGGSLAIRAGGNAGAMFGGAIAGTGAIEIHGTLRLSGNAAWPAGVSLVNHGLLDIMTWQGELPAGFVNHGTVLDRSNVRIDGFEAAGNDFKLRVHGYNSHGYRLQWTDDLSSGIWHDVGETIAGADAPIEFIHPDGAAASRRFYRVAVSP